MQKLWPSPSTFALAKNAFSIQVCNGQKKQLPSKMEAGNKQSNIAVSKKKVSQSEHQIIKCKWFINTLNPYKQDLSHQLGNKHFWWMIKITNIKRQMQNKNHKPLADDADFDEKWCLQDMALVHRVIRIQYKTMLWKTHSWCNCKKESWSKSKRLQ